MRKQVAAGLGALMLAACSPAPLVGESAPSPVTPAQQARLLWGQTAPSRAIQASADEVAPFATVSLRSADGDVVATGTTDAAGRFGLNPFVAFDPVAGAIYVLEVSKRFTTTNEGSLLRLSTLVRWNGSHWESVSGTSQDAPGVLIDAGTTAVSVIQALRGLASAPMIGAVSSASGAFTPGTTGIPAADFERVKELVGNALTANLDPVRAIVYSATEGAYRVALDAGRGKVLFDLKTAPTLSGHHSPVRTPFGAGFAVAASSSLFVRQIGGYGRTQGNFDGPGSLATDPWGNLYVCNFSGSPRIMKLDGSGRHLFTFGTVGTDNGQFGTFGGIDTDALGNLWVADGGGNRLQKFDPTGRFLMAIGQGRVWGANEAPSTGAGTANGWLDYAHFLRVDRRGRVWVTEWLNHRVSAFWPNGGFARGIGWGGTWTGDPAPLTKQASDSPGFFSGPSGLAFDPEGNVWINDRNNHRIQKFTEDGALLGVYGGPSVMDQPQGIAIDRAGNAWVGELANGRVLKFAPNGTKVGEFGGPGSEPGCFLGIQGVEVDPDGYLLVTDYQNHRIQQFAPASQALKFATAGRLDPAQGTVSMWIRPAWSGTAPGRFNLFESWTKPAGLGDGIALFKNGATVEVNYWPHAASGTVVRGDISRWEPWEDHHVAFTWGPGGLALYLDGQLAGSAAWPGAFQLPDALCVGTTNYTPPHAAQAIFGSLKIHDYPKTGAEVLRDARRMEQD